MDFKYFVEITKAITEDGKIFVQGVATGTLTDGAGEKLDRQSVINFLEEINRRAENGDPMPLFDGHPHDGNIQEQIGDIVFGQMLDQEDDPLFIKAELDPDHPSTPLLLKRIRQGKKFAFSIVGFADPNKTRMTFDRLLGDYVREFVDMVPKAISITSKPAYMASFLEVVTKALKSDLTATDNSNYNNLNINNNSMKKKSIKTDNLVEKSEETTAEVVEQTAETTEAAPVETTEAVVEEKPVTEEVTEEKPEATEAVETEEVVEKALPEEGKKMMGAKELIKALEALGYEVSATKKVEKSLTDTVTELVEVTKSLSSQLEAMKDLPFRKKSVATLVEKSHTDRAFNAGPENFQENYKKLIEAN